MVVAVAAVAAVQSVAVAVAAMAAAMAAAAARYPESCTALVLAGNCTVVVSVEMMKPDQHHTEHCMSCLVVQVVVGTFVEMLGH